MKYSTLRMAALAATLSAAVPALADGQIDIGHDLSQNVNVNGVTESNIGNGDTLLQEVGAVSGRVKVGHDLNQNVKANGVVLFNIGNGDNLTQRVGVVTSH